MAHDGALDTSTVSIAPPPQNASGSLLDSPPSDVADWRKAGLNAIGEGRLGVLLLAGGQGTRLGSSAPKGCYDIGLPSHKSLFQLQAERIAAIVKLAGTATSLPWYIMTSGPTRGPTEAFFREHHFFGLSPADVIFFEQGVLPCFAEDGKFLLDTPSSLSVAPDGNGGVYAALNAPLDDSKMTVLSDLRRRGVYCVHVYCVDNCLVRVADPTFVGYCLSRNADCGALVVRKTRPDESVGVVAVRNGKFGVLEYSEIPKELAERRDGDSPTSPLSFRAANIANHFFTVEFLERVQEFSSEMSLHVARKKVPHIDLKNGSQVKPTSPNAIKLEAFIFDVFPFAERMAILEDDRAECFSPLKNKAGTGVDDEGTSRAHLLAQQSRWLEAAGADLSDHEIELSPLVSVAGEGLETVNGKKATKSGNIENWASLSTFFA